MKTPFYREFQKIKPELLRKIKDYYGDNLLGVALFGSVVRGDLTTSSDIDIILILKESNLSFRERIIEFWEKVAEGLTLLGYFIPLSPIIYTLEEFKIDNPFFLNFLEALDILYEKDEVISRLVQKLQEYLILGKVEKKMLGGRLYFRYGS